MRLIGHLANETSASILSDYLYVEGIANVVEAAGQEGWAVWVHLEDELPRAKEILQAYVGNPGDPKYSKEGRRARELRAQAEVAVDEATSRVKGRSELLRAGSPYGVGALTSVLMGVCVAVQLLRETGFDEAVLRELCMTALSHAPGARIQHDLPEIFQGQFWRLFTPVLVHARGGLWMHLVFNMLNLMSLGSVIEDREGTGRLGWLVVLIAVLSNLCQYWWSGPAFYGMSGVVYGLMAYVWVRGKRDPGSGLFLHPQTVMMGMVWFFLCLFGQVPGIANGAHLGGLVIGLICGFLVSLPTRSVR